MKARDTILILDFGSQTTALIGRRIRELGVCTAIVPGSAPLDDAALAGVKGIILSGSPESVNAEGAAPDQRIYTCGLPLLGICYGLHRVTADNGGTVETLDRREYGGIKVTVDTRKIKPFKKPHFAAYRFFSGFLEKAPLNFRTLLTGHESTVSWTAWMSHGDTVTAPAPGFIEAARSASGHPAILYHQEKPWFGVQFHPEVSHCERGSALIAAFALDVCGAAKSWKIENYLEESRAQLRERAGSAPVLLLISGGVDSTVCAALLLKTLDAEQVHLMYLDTGLMRKNETEEVTRILRGLGARHIHCIYCADDFFTALRGITSPEEKRKLIGDTFISVQEREVKRLGLPETAFLAQGTLYTDLVESGKGVGKNAHLIKSHHNVGSPLVAALRDAGKILEPLAQLYKDEARELGRLLGLDEAVINRHPFPGPGLAVRILGEVTREKCDVLREADALFIDELKRRRNPQSGAFLYNEIWQAFAVLLPVQSVGVAGDGRAYGSVIALRAVTSADGMTADVYPFNPEDIYEIAALITNTVPGVGRVTLDISSKPPATIEWE